MCTHEDLKAEVGIVRLADTGRFMAEIKIHCQHCGKFFQFLGLEPGLNLVGASVSLDGLQAQIAIVPEGSAPTPLQRMMLNQDRLM